MAAFLWVVVVLVGYSTLFWDVVALVGCGGSCAMWRLLCDVADLLGCGGYCGILWLL